jgi:hypothetical protein
LQLRLVGFLFDLQLFTIVVILVPLSLCWWRIVASAAQFREEVGGTLSSHGLELRLGKFLCDWLLLHLLLLLLWLQQLAAETPLHFLYDLGLIVPKGLKQLVE